ncbi:phosphatidylinositol-4-phosphate 5-Kinase [Drepanopeziza brunnea f. sp. 'multigermtubi' MB_m1]|uniref:1-phosphatidylinositol-3-phosphate 5-kinase n=1 Tax=Marssonina brunnea f. sp. multigermtubi (strain MB_m1) TaxID=1072389 RepID=K1XJV1_MARBU|nr:phosphatidylinositol-4-phosphate 5-Kinase [Drepanopeziza brunnea f. sp. 'multigermtubi' MB_m1]EKD12669.1 phosphatidylinositol-4-phosphate 5-Kinase [Drepanopeziza brunnea f. sp. 'multigermtubi' MB_m1]
MSSSHDSPRASIGPPSTVGFRSRRNSLASLAGSAPIDKEQLAQALDKIHSTASHSETLTTFNEFTSPPPSSTHTESKGIAGEIMQNGLSGLYSRFRGAVGVAKDKAGSTSASKADPESVETASLKSQNVATPTSRGSVAPTREESGTTVSPVLPSTTSSRLQSPTSSSFAAQFSETQSQIMKSSKASLGSTPATTPTASKSGTSGRPPITPMTKATASSVIVPTLAAVNVSAFKDGDTERNNVESQKIESLPSLATGKHENMATSVFDPKSRRATKGSVVDEPEASDNDLDEARMSLANPQTRPARHFMGGDGSIEEGKKAGSTKTASSALSSLRATDFSRANPSSLLTSDGAKRPAAIERIAQSHLPGYPASRASSADRSTAEASPITTSAHNSVRHESFAVDDPPQRGYLGRLRIPGTTTNEGAPEAVNARLERMRKQVLSKEFWMKDEICKECFSCGDSFSAFRRKHHCRTCGCIFDAKCTSIVDGQKFGVQGTLRVCRTCLDIITRRHDSSGSEDSDDDSALPSFYHSQQAKYDASTRTGSTGALGNVKEGELASTEGTPRPLATPMMAIPATRRIGDPSNSRSAILEIDAPQLSRPSSSRSLKALSAAGRPASSGHKRHHSKHNFLGRFKTTAGERAPFQGGITEDLSKQSRLPAFHDDNIIDPDIAPYMSDQESSEEEQPSIYAMMNSGSIASPNFENDRSGFGSLLGAGKKHRARNGDKSVSGISFTSRADDVGGSVSMGGYSRPNRRRNLSAASNNQHLSRTSPRQPVQGFGNLDEDIASVDDISSNVNIGPSRMIRSVSMRDSKAPAIELNNASLHHVRRLLHQLLEDANIPNVSAWEKALVPILLQCTDDVNPNVRFGDDIDICHYVKLKKIPGGKPGDTAYVSGIVFSKNLALKSMPRSISNPRIVIISFPIEYSRHHNHFMSLEPVIAQEKEFLKNMVNRIASLRPQLLLVQKHISGLALQYLEEANIAVAYNVKQSVIEAVSRFAQTEIISSIDMVALNPVHIGRSAGFDVKTYVHKDIPGRKKSYIYLSGCPKELGCTIALRGADMATLTKMKTIAEFMVYVVYNLKLETCLMRDEFVLIPSIAENSGSTSPSRQQATHATQLGGPEHVLAAATDKLQAVADAGMVDQVNPPTDELASQSSIANDASSAAVSQPSNGTKSVTSTEPSKYVSAHASHAHGSHEDQIPEDIPMPTFYSDMVAKHRTKILSASPFVKFVQPYLLMRSRQQEQRLSYLKRLRDQDTFEEQTDTEKSKPQKFQLIRPEMVHETVKRAPRQIMEVLHAVHDAEYDKALHNYQTQKRQWETYIQSNLNLFDPYAHQTITVLYTVVCTATTIPCSGPDLVAFVFYNQHSEYDSDCTLGQYVEDLCLSVNTVCTSNGCERKMTDHHRTYVHGEARITVFVEKSPCKIKGLQDSILMWSYCKICQKETQVMPMSESTWKYSLGKYLELSFWSSELRLRAGFCPHDIHRDHLRYFGYRNVAIRIHYDPIDLLEIVVPRTRITWKVDNDLRLKNDLFTKSEERWNRFMASVLSRIKGINIDSVAPEKAEACKAEVESLMRRAQDEHASLIRKLQEKYMDSKYYEIIPLNRAIRAMQEKVAEWDDAFAEFDANFFPSEKDIRRLAALQLKKMFIDRDESTTSIATEAPDVGAEVDEKFPSTSLELTRKSSNASAEEVQEVLASVVEENPTTPISIPIDGEMSSDAPLSQPEALDLDRDGINHLDLAAPIPNTTTEQPLTEDALSSDPCLSASPVASANSGAEVSTSPLESTLSEKVEKLRKAHLNSSGEPSMSSEISGIPRPSERKPSRRNGMAIAPPINRTQSHPAGTLRRLPIGSRSSTKNGETNTIEDSSTPSLDSLKPSTTDPLRPTDKKLSERLGIGSIKAHRKAGHSLIPRSVNSKRKETKVSALAKHFEQLSREFEKERMRDKKQRAAKVTQSRAFPKASSKPIVEVYKDVNEAVEERGQSDEAVSDVQPTHPDADPTSVVDGLADLNTDYTTNEPGLDSPTNTAATPDEGTAETDDNQQNASQAGSDDEGAASDVDHSMLDMIPGIAEIAESLGAGKPNAEIPLEIPKHEKSSLMKILTNFWAERSASGWTPLEYPVNAGDHIFADVDVIVREDEPSSLIAFTLSTPDYQKRLVHLREASAKGDQQPPLEPDNTSDFCEDGLDQTEVETALLQATGTHLSYNFSDGSAQMRCKVFFAEQFDAVRRKCGVSDRIVESLSRCLKWDSKGGKTKSVFLKTLDDRLVIKSLSQVETAAFLKFAPAYFEIMAQALFHDLPTVIAKMLGFYQIVIKNPVTGTEIKWDVLVMENLFYDRSPTRIFDLKGSMRNRKIQSTGEQNEVLLDENMVEFIYESPLFAREHSKKLLRSAIFNDTLFLQRNDVMDYSLMVAVDEARKELVVGIIDVVRTYTWDKKLESWIKDRGFAGGGRNRPTEYKSRFREAMNRYILQAPNSWHQWTQPQFYARPERDGKPEPTADRTAA